MIFFFVILNLFQDLIEKEMLKQVQHDERLPGRHYYTPY